MTPPEIPEKKAGTTDLANKQAKNDQTKEWSQGGNQTGAEAEALKKLGDTAGKVGSKALEAAKGIVEVVAAPVVDLGKKFMGIDQDQGKKASAKPAETASPGKDDKQPGGKKTEAAPPGSGNKEKGKGSKPGSQDQKNKQTRKWAEVRKEKTVKGDGQAGDKSPAEKKARAETKGPTEVKEPAEEAGSSGPQEVLDNHPGDPDKDKIPTNQELREKLTAQLEKTPGGSPGEHPFLGMDGEIKIPNSAEMLDRIIGGVGSEHGLPDGRRLSGETGRTATRGENLAQREPERGEAMGGKDRVEHFPTIQWLSDQSPKDPTQAGDASRLFQMAGSRDQQTPRPEDKDSRPEATGNGDHGETKPKLSYSRLAWVAGLFQSDVIDEVRATPEADDRAAICAGIAAGAYTLFSDRDQMTGVVQEGKTLERMNFLESIRAPNDVRGCIFMEYEKTGDVARINAGVLKGAEIARDTVNAALEFAGSDPEKRRQALVDCAHTLNSAAYKVLLEDSGKPVSLLR